MYRTVATHQALPTIAAGCVLASAGTLGAVVAPDDTSRGWRAVLTAVAAILLLTAVAVAVVFYRQSRQRRRRHQETARAGLPRWATELPLEWQEELADRFTDLHSRYRRSEHAVAESRRRSTQTANAAWQIVSSGVNAEERARARFVADLHDTVVQAIIVCTYLAENEDTPRDELAEQLREAEQQLRELMVSTRPLDLARGNLGTAATNLSKMMERRHGLRVAWGWPTHDGELPESVSHTIYRFWQEGLSNVAKHAGVDRAHAGLTLGHHVVAWVEDDGAGFGSATTADAVNGGQHVGLGLMRDRAKQIGARIEVSSAPGTGTRVELSMPYPPANAERPVAIGSSPAPPTDPATRPR